MSESKPCSSIKFIIMPETRKALADRWPPSGHLPSGYFPKAFKKPHPKYVPHYHDYQLLDYLYISPRITLIKAPKPVLTKTSVPILFSLYDTRFPCKGRAGGLKRCLFHWPLQQFAGCKIQWSSMAKCGLSCHHIVR